ncbi:MAG: NAD-dependent dihydropyrimidine dehydrogenase subunit PreA [Bdellovibrio sp.]|nr:MAG: NAD-dependent dihydropyrimidine dehydrogenase subunit PreA [Bdellovibrio sp.]
MTIDLTTKFSGLSSGLRSNIQMINPFIVGSGPPTTNRATIAKAFREGWGGAVAKTISLDHEKVKNVSPRYGKLYSREHHDVVGFENIELISDRPLSLWLDDFRQLKREFPDRVLIASIMEEHAEERWRELVQKCEAAGVDGFELNLSCPHGLPERKMGAAMGQDPQLVHEVTAWVRKATPKPIWAKLTPNVGDITMPALSALKAGAEGLSMINTILSVIGVDLTTLRPLPTVGGLSTFGGYSSIAVKPISLRMLVQVMRAMQEHGFADRSISGIGGVTCARDAIEYLLLGASTVQACTGPMLQGFAMIHELTSGLAKFMEQHGFQSIDAFRGHSIQYLTRFSHLLGEEGETNHAQPGLASDDQWSGDKINSQTGSMSSN